MFTFACIDKQRQLDKEKAERRMRRYNIFTFRSKASPSEIKDEEENDETNNSVVQSQSMCNIM